MKHKRDKDEPLTATILSHMMYTQRRLETLGKLLSRYGISVYDYIKKAKKEGWV